VRVYVGDGILGEVLLGRSNMARLREGSKAPVRGRLVKGEGAVSAGIYDLMYDAAGKVQGSPKVGD